MSELSLSGDKTVRPTNHVVLFAGEEPCDHLGQPLERLINHRGQQSLSEQLVVDLCSLKNPLTAIPTISRKCLHTLQSSAAMRRGLIQTLLVKRFRSFATKALALSSSTSTHLRVGLELLF